MTRAPRPRRHPAAVALGLIAGALLALPAMAVAPWMFFGVLAGWDGGDIGTGEPGPTDWGLLLGSLALLVLCVAVPVGVGWGLCRLLDLVLGRRSGQAGHQLPG